MTEQQVREDWTVGQFRAYRDFALELMKNRQVM